MASKPRGLAKGGISKQKPAASGAGGGKDLGAWAVGELLGHYNNKGTYQPGRAASGGTPGYTISRQGERDQVSAQGKQARRNVDAVYKDINGKVRGRNPQIKADYDTMTADLRSNAKSVVESQRADMDARAKARAVAAKLMGFGGVPQTSGAGDKWAQLLGAHTSGQAENWAGFNSGASSRAVERNNAVGDAFLKERGDKLSGIDQIITQLLAGIQDQYVPGTPGRAATAGRMVGATTPKDQRYILKEVLGFYDKDVKNDLSAGRLANSNAGLALRASK